MLGTMTFFRLLIGGTCRRREFVCSYVLMMCTASCLFFPEMLRLVLAKSFDIL